MTGEKSMMSVIRTSLCAAAILAATGSWSFADGGGYGYGHPMWSEGWGGMFMGGGMMVVFMLIVIVAIVLLFRSLLGGTGNNDNSNNRNSALDILNERYAQGEIDTAEYNERKKAIREQD